LFLPGQFALFFLGRS